MKSVKIHSAYKVKKPIKIPTVKDDEVLVIRIGSEERPASDEDIRLVKETLDEYRGKRGHLTIVSHHCMSFVVMKRKDLDNGVAMAYQNTNK